jgi:integrase
MARRGNGEDSIYRRTDGRWVGEMTPHAEGFEIQPLSVEQAHQLLAVARGHRLEALFSLALSTGMRRGELLALKWQDISFPTGTLQIRRVLTRVPSKMPGKGYVETEPKTQKSKRSIVIAPFALEALKQHRIHQLTVIPRSHCGNQL